MAVLSSILALQRLGYKEPPEELSPTELPQQWRRPRRAMAPEGVMSVSWRQVREGRPLAPLQCTAREFLPPAVTEEEQREAVVKLSGSLNEGNSCWAAILAKAASARRVEAVWAYEGSAKAAKMPVLPAGFECLVPWHEQFQARKELEPAPLYK